VLWDIDWRGERFAMGTRPKEDKVIKLTVLGTESRGMEGRKKDDVMKWKSFTLRVLLLVMVGKRIKEPRIFTAVALE